MGTYNIPNEKSSKNITLLRNTSTSSNFHYATLVLWAIWKQKVIQV